MVRLNPAHSVKSGCRINANRIATFKLKTLKVTRCLFSLVVTLVNWKKLYYFTGYNLKDSSLLTKTLLLRPRQRTNITTCHYMSLIGFQRPTNTVAHYGATNWNSPQKPKNNDPQRLTAQNPDRRSHRDCQSNAGIGNYSAGIAN